MRRAQTAVQFGGWFHWPVFVMATLELENIFLFRVGVSNQNFTDGFLLVFDFFSSHCNRHLRQSALFTLLCMTRHSCSNLMLLRYERLLQWQQNISKATMWLQNSCYSRVPKSFLVAWQLCVACYYPTIPTDYPSTTRGTSVGPPVTVNTDFCGYLPFLSISCLNYMGTEHHWQPFWSTTRVRFIGQSWYFNPQWTARQEMNKGEMCL